MTVANILEFVKVVGLPLALVLFFIYRDYQRESNLSKRITEVEDFQRKTLQDLVAETTAAIVKSSEIVERNTEVMDNFTQVVMRCKLKAE